MKAETSGADYGGEKKEVVVRFTVPNGAFSRTLKRVTVGGTQDPESPEVRKVIDAGMAEFSGRFVLLNKAKTVVSTHATEDEAKTAARALVSREGRKNTVSDKGISVEKAERTGEARRLPGEDVSSDRLRETFKFKGVNFGNWMKGDANEKERQLHLNHAYDSFMDLAEVIGVPPEAMSLNGMLGVAIGAQGSGGFAAAHFVPGVNEINLTRESGAGSLAHEWGHALDHYFARQASLTRAGAPFLTAHLKAAEGAELRPEILDKFKAIVQAMRKRPITQEEAAAKRQESIASAQRNLDGWLKSIVRGDLMDDPEVSKAIERIKSGDLGDGSVAVGRTSAVKPAIAEFGKIIKDKTGRVLQRTDLSAIYSWAGSLKYLQSQGEGDAAHVPQQMVETQYSKDATSLDKDKGGKPYWSTTLEMFARAFDTFVSDTLEAKAAKNTYLSHAGRDGKTVPTGTERTTINEAIKGLIDAVETKPGEDGNVLLYNVATDTRATHADKAVFDMAWDGKSSAEILSFISKASRRPFNRVLARHLARIGVSSTITLDSQGGWSFGNTSQAQRYAAAYNPRTDTVALFTPREAERHILHELVHAATLKAIAAGGLPAIQMRALFRNVQKNGALAGQYGMSNLDEFVAEAFSNPKFQQALKNIPASKVSTLRNAWEWFVRLVANVLGLKTPVQRTALDRTLTIGAKLMQENAALAGAANGADRYALDRIALLERNGEKLDAIRAADAVRYSKDMPLQFRSDIPNDRWLQQKAATAEAKGKDRYGVPHMGALTGSFSGPVNVPVSILSRLKGENGEQNNIRQADLDRLTKIMRETGSLPLNSSGEEDVPYIEVAHDGSAWVNEGNHRIMAAQAVGIDSLPVEIRYFDGGERKPGVMHPSNFANQLQDNPDIRFSAGSDWLNHPRMAPARNIITNAMHSDKNTSWLTPFNTQYHKAEKWANEGKARFKVVFDLVQRFLGDVSKFAILAQNSAPTLLHEWRTLADVRDTLAGGDILGKQHRADVAAIASPLYEGTLYGGGNPMSGIRWSDSQLRAKFNLTDRQIKIYHEAMAAVNVSMDELAKSIVSQHAKREMVTIDTDMSLEDVAADVADKLRTKQETLREEIGRVAQEVRADEVGLADEDGNKAKARDLKNELSALMRKNHAEIERLDKVIADVEGISEKNQRLQAAGYFPLMRFGEHTVTAKDADGKVQFFGMYEGVPLMPRSGQYEANKVAAELRAAFPEWTVTTGIKNDEKYKLYQGLNIEAIQLFAEHMDQESLEPFQEFIRLATNNRSAQRRLLHRKGTPGFDKDVRRTLAQFMVSNSRVTSSNYHMQDMLRAAEDAEKDGGDIGEEAIKLVEYVRNPTEEAQALRGFLFFQFLGGSLASAVVNLTQTPAMTLPFLSKFEPTKKLTMHLIAVAKLAAGKPEAIQDETLREALMRAEQDGVTAPQEIYQLTATAANNVFSGSRIASVLLRGWGAPFSMAEGFNRRIAFITAFQIAEKMGPDLFTKTGFKDSFMFAEDVVNQTQGIYNKGNRMNVGRGAAGSVLMTFKQYSIMYMELFKRLPPKQRAIMFGILILAAGGGGLPGVEDIEDLWDTIGQWLGFSSNSKRTLRNTLTEWVGKDAADVAINGVLSRLGVDLHSRLGMQNLIPGTGILKQSSVDKGRDIEEFFGPAASVIKSLGDALESLATGHPDRAAMSLLPSSVRNLAQGSKMAVKGYSEDAKGRKGVPVNEWESAAKMIGFNPKSVADYGAVKRDLAQDQRLINVKREEFSSAIADAILADDQKARAEALQSLRDWNAENPDARVSITAAAIGKRVRDARAEGATRMLRSLPKGMRNQAREEFAQ
ncbi:MAG: PLxRFG domain-containing protein [Candidatus Accumulibacter sp.]|nr:PLxRFG domain-containing protein [Accumulibacter sp.]